MLVATLIVVSSIAASLFFEVCSIVSKSMYYKWSFLVGGAAFFGYNLVTINYKRSIAQYGLFLEDAEQKGWRYMLISQVETLLLRNDLVWLYIICFSFLLIVAFWRVSILRQSEMV